MIALNPTDKKKTTFRLGKFDNRKPADFFNSVIQLYVKYNLHIW